MTGVIKQRFEAQARNYPLVIDSTPLSLPPLDKSTPGGVMVLWMAQEGKKNKKRWSNKALASSVGSVVPQPSAAAANALRGREGRKCLHKKNYASTTPVVLE